MVKRGTNYVLDDEPCIGLYEMEEQAPDSKGFHRYQIIHVMRNDELAEYRKDLGLAKKFKHDSIRIPGGARMKGVFYIEHTVGELRDIADAVRNKPAFDKRELAQIN